MPSSLRKSATACETSSSSRAIRRGAEFDHRHLASEAAIGLCEFKTDVTAAQDDEMRREEIDVHHRAVGEIRDLIEAGDRGNRRARADIDEHAVGRDLRTVHCDFLFGDKAAMALVNRTAFQRLERSLDPVMRWSHDGVLARLDGLMSTLTAPRSSRHSRRRGAQYGQHRRSLRVS